MASTATSATPAEPTRPKIPDSEKECYNFRKGQECVRSPCLFMHACQLCKATTHGSKACPDKPEVVRTTCEVCQVTLDVSTMAVHLEGRAHAKKANPPTQETCEVCQVTYPSNVMQQHLQGKSHAKKAARASGNPQEGNQTTCELCQVTVDAHSMAGHLAGKLHAKKANPRTMETCEVCNITLDSQVMQEHLQGKGHVKKAKAAALASGVQEAKASPPVAPPTTTTSGQEMCEICQITLDAGAMPSHLAGKAHFKKANPPTNQTCEICQVTCDTRYMESHLKGKAHSKRLRQVALASEDSQTKRQKVQAS